MASKEDLPTDSELEFNPLLDVEDDDDASPGEEVGLPSIDTFVLPHVDVARPKRGNGTFPASEEVFETVIDEPSLKPVIDDADALLAGEFGLYDEDDELDDDTLYEQADSADPDSEEYQAAWGDVEEELAGKEEEEEDELGGFRLDEVLGAAIDMEASDVDIIADDEVSFEIRGDMHRADEFGVLTPEVTTRLQLNIISHVLEADFVENLELDTAYVLKTGVHAGRRTRLSVGKSFGEIFLVFRVIADQIPTPASLGVPKVIQDWCELPNGLVLICGPTGSGKALGLSTPLVTPTGWKTMAEVKVGDELVSSQGTPTKVTSVSSVDETPTLYQVRLSDGQEIFADANHQWIVADHRSRNSARHAKTKRIRARRELGLKNAEKLWQVGHDLSSMTLTIKQLFKIITRLELTLEFGDEGSVYRALRFMDVPFDRGQYSTKYYNAYDAFTALSVRIYDRYNLGIKSIFKVLTTEELVSEGLLTSGRANFAIKTYDGQHMGEHKNLPIDPYLLGAWLSGDNSGDGRIAPDLQDVEEMAELVSEVWPGRVDVKVGVGAAIITCSSNNQDQCIREHENTTAEGRRKECDGVSQNNKKYPPSVTLSALLERLEIKNNKHIPSIYLRSSFEQRLALVQGLMDAAGSAHKGGHGMGMGFSNEILARDALELVRSLGIKAIMRKRKASYKDIYNIDFVTTLPIFRLKRKLTLVPSVVSERQKWLYIKAVDLVASEDVSYEAVKCVTVDAEDSSYICGGFITTHNSTTFASMIRKIQLERAQKIITIEKPIEYVYGTEGKAVIVQREIGKDSRTFAGALKSAMRQHPKIIMVGEVRDQEEVDEVLRAAETGHLALTTLHATSPPGAINRIMSLYEGEDRLRILSSLKDNVRGIANQTLVKTKDGKSRVALYAILTVTPEVSLMIGAGDVEGLQNYMRDNELTMEHKLAKAVSEGVCHLEDARAQAAFPTLFDELINEQVNEK